MTQQTHSAGVGFERATQPSFAPKQRLRGANFFHRPRARLPMLMFDGGAFMHIWGTMLVDLDLLTDWQDLDTPLRVQTAKGTLTLTQLATLTLRGQAFSGAINPHMQLSLISEGMLFVEKNWKFINESGSAYLQARIKVFMPTW